MKSAKHKKKSHLVYELACVAWRFCRAGRTSSKAARKIKKSKNQSPRGFSALARLYYLARSTKTTMLRRLLMNWYALPLQELITFWKRQDPLRAAWTRQNTRHQWALLYFLQLFLEMLNPQMTLLNLLIPPQVQLHMKRSLELNFLSLSLNSLMRMFVTKWSTFWDAYEAFIHKNNSIDKFNYLNSILEKTASEKPFQVYPMHHCFKLWGGYRFFEGQIWK